MATKASSNQSKSQEDKASSSSMNQKLAQNFNNRKTELWLVTKENNSTMNNNNNNNSKDEIDTQSVVDFMNNHDNIVSVQKISSLLEFRDIIPCLNDEGDSLSLVEENDHKKQSVRTSATYEDDYYHRMNDSNDLNNNNNDKNREITSTLSIRTTNNKVFLDEVKRFELFHSIIKHEDDLLNERVSWIILAQSFLMAAFITNTSSSGADQQQEQYSLKYITAMVGLLTVVVTMPAILAAGRNIELQQKVYFAHISSDERCRELHGHERNLDLANMHRKEEYRERIQNGHIFPNLAFRGRGSVPILFTVVALAVVQVAGWCFLLTVLVMNW